MPTICGTSCAIMPWKHWPIDDAVLVLDETGFLKQGKASCGVGRQYTGSAGKITNCQIGVFAAYVSRHGHAFIDWALYLPKAWTNDPARLRAAHVPPDITFATKPALARAMIKRAISAKVPFRWVAADSVYGVGEAPSVARRKALPPGSPLRTGSDFRPGKAPRDRAGMIGPIWSWPILRRASSVRTSQTSGYAACWSAAPSPMVSWLFSQYGSRLERRLRPWPALRAIAGPLRTASRPPRTNSASITMKPAPGTVGTAMSVSLCSPSPCWQPSAARPIPCNPTTDRRKKPDRHRQRTFATTIDPLVCSGNPPHRRQTLPTPDQSCPHYRMVGLA